MKTKIKKKSKTIKRLILYMLFIFPIIVCGQLSEDNVNTYLSANSEVSSIGLTTNIKSREIVNLLKAQLQNPIVTGESPELGFMLHADESITIEDDMVTTTRL